MPFSTAVAVATVGEISDVRDPIFLQDYETLRGIVTGTMLAFITGPIGTGSNNNIAGWFLRDDNDTTSVDNNYSVIIGVGDKRWKRITSSEISELLVDAIAAANSAAASAATAESFADLISALSINNNTALVDTLIGTETTAIAIDARASYNYVMKTIDAANVANNRTGAITAFYTGVFAVPKLTLQSDGSTLKWSPHNYAKQTNQPHLNVSGCTAVATAGSRGTNNAALATATVGAQASLKQLAVGSGVFTGAYWRLDWTVKASGGTAPWGYIGYDDGADHFSYFNFATLVAGTVAAGSTMSISQLRADGTVLPTGWYRVSVYFQTTTGTVNIHCGGCDADNNKAITVGRTWIAEEPMYHLGVLPLEYFENTGTTPRIGTPLDWSRGEQCIPLEDAVTYNSVQSDNLSVAPWVATNITPVYGGGVVGPHGEPCTRLTATANGGTISQAVVAASTTQMFQGRFKRITGTGTIRISTDNGATWEDITSRLRTTGFTQVWRAATTNPTMIIEMGTNGDVIDASLVEIGGDGLLSSSMPIHATARTRTADVPNFLTNLVTPGSSYTLYADFYRGYGAPFPDDSVVRIGNTAFTQEMRITLTAATGAMGVRTTDGVTTLDYGLYVPTDGQRIEFTAQIAANDHCFSINGEPTGRVHTVGMPTVEQIRLAGGSPILLRRLLLVPNKNATKDGIRSFRYSNTLQSTNLVGCCTVAWDSDTAYPDTSMNRAPVVEILEEHGDYVDGLVFWCQKRAGSWFHSETPMRIMQATVRFNLVTGEVKVIRKPAVIQQQSGWTGGTGHLQSPNCFTILQGPFKGRRVLLTTGLEQPTFTPDQRSVFCSYNDSPDCDPGQWTNPNRVDPALVGLYRIAEPSGSKLVLPPSHPHAPNRLLTTLTLSGGTICSLYSDGDGVSWQTGPNFVPPVGETVDEASIALLPNGDIVGTCRVTSGVTTRRLRMLSIDGGKTFTEQGMIAGYAYSPESNCMNQADPTGITGANGKILLGHPVSATNRHGFQIDISTDGGVTWPTVLYPFAGRLTRYFGYNSFKTVAGGSHIIGVIEGDTPAFNVRNTVYAFLTKLP